MELVEETTQVEIKRRRFTVADYLRMVEAELFVEGDRVELIEGEFVEMSPIYITHISTLNRLVWLLSNALGKQVILSVQNPVQLSEDNLPQPDVAVFRFQEKFYSEQTAEPDVYKRQAPNRHRAAAFRLPFLPKTPSRLSRVAI